MRKMVLLGMLSVGFAATAAQAQNLFVSNEGSNTIREFSPTGTDLGHFATTGLSFPADLAFGPAPPPTGVPEPGALGRLLSGVLPAGAFAWRRRKGR